MSQIGYLSDKLPLSVRMDSIPITA